MLHFFPVNLDILNDADANSAIKPNSHNLDIKT